MIKQLYQGYGIVSPEQFADQLENGYIEVWELMPGAYALIAWADTKFGKTLNVLTTVGDSSFFRSGLVALEKIARAKGATAIYSVGHPGWTPYLREQGYTVNRAIVMTKELK